MKTQNAVHELVKQTINNRAEKRKKLVYLYLNALYANGCLTSKYKLHIWDPYLTKTARMFWKQHRLVPHRLDLQLIPEQLLQTPHTNVIISVLPPNAQLGALQLLVNTFSEHRLYLLVYCVLLFGERIRELLCNKHYTVLFPMSSNTDYVWLSINNKQHDQLPPLLRTQPRVCKQRTILSYFSNP